MAGGGNSFNAHPQRGAVTGIITTPLKIQLDGANNPTFLQGSTLVSSIVHSGTGLYTVTMYGGGTGAQGYGAKPVFPNGACVTFGLHVGGGQANPTASLLSAQRVGVCSFLAGGTWMIGLVSSGTGAYADPPAKTATNNVILDIFIDGFDGAAPAGTGANSSWGAAVTTW